jgi:hypothetical protein
MSDDGYDGGAAADEYDYGGPTFDEAYVVRCSIKILHFPRYLLSFVLG